MYYISNPKLCSISGDLKNLSVEKSAVAMKDVKWHTHNATVGFLVAGLYLI